MKTLTQVVQELDHSLFDTYVKPKAAAVTAIVRKGVLDPGMDWYDSPRPAGKLHTTTRRFQFRSQRVPIVLNSRNSSLYV